ncbi:hypothetical protein ElyMa_006794400 [Elysia marginata]|uniref:Uncharacterized protein n=1 Tax=Elysia marginata TaxID=1093978 RepID=A0AAV4J546_9GAST|nr:hypothetical protein ElyMa_006794400 [Elysia marginata]
MKQRMQEYKTSKGRLKRGSSIHESRTLERQYNDILDQIPIEMSCCKAVPAWSEEAQPSIECGIHGIDPKIHKATLRLLEKVSLPLTRAPLSSPTCRRMDLCLHG